jgi:hypothetical protein
MIGWAGASVVGMLISIRIVHVCDDFGGAAVSQPPESKACNVSIVHSNLFGAWKAPLLWLRPAAAQ